MASILLMVPLCLGCDGHSDVEIFNIRTGCVVGQLSPSVGGQYRNMVIGMEDASGRVAIIKWGYERSILKLATLQPWQVMEYTVDVGRGTGIDGQMSCDFANECFIYVTGNRVTTIARDGERRTYSVPLRKGYGITNAIIPTAEGIVFVSGTPYGDDRGFALHRTNPDGDVREFFHSSGSLPAIHACDNSLWFVDRPRGTDTTPRLMQLDLATLAESQHTLKWNDGRYALSTGCLLSLSRDEAILRAIPLESPNAAREYAVPANDGYRIYDLAGAAGYAVLMRSSSATQNYSHLIIDLASGAMTARAANKNYARVRVMCHAEVCYGILAD